MTTPTIYDGLRAYFKFENTLVPGFDSTKYGIDGVLTNAALDTGKRGLYGLRTSTAAGKMTLPSNPFINATAQISVSLWVYLDKAPSLMWGGGIPMFVDKRGGLTSGYALGALSPGTDKIGFQVFNSAGTPYTAEFTETSFGAWIHYVGVYEGAVVRLYRNGVSVATAAADGTQRYNQGADLVVGLGLEGVLDEITVWDKQLSGANVTTLYGAGNGLDIIYPEGFGIGYNGFLGTIDEPYGELEANPVEAAQIDPEAINIPTIDAESGTNQNMGAVVAPYGIVDSPEREFIDPEPSIISVVVDSNHDVVAIANAGPTDAGLLVTWWEITLPSGDVVVTADRITGQLFDTNHNQQDGWQVPLGQSWNGYQIRFFMEAASDASQQWSSDPVTLNDDNFDNPVPIVIPTFIDPEPEIVTVDIDGLYNVHATGKVGPSDAANVVTWWEVEITPGEFLGTIERRFPVDVSTAQQTITDVFLAPEGLNLRGKTIRFVAQAEQDVDQRWYSDPYLLTDTKYDRSTYVPAPLVPNVPTLVPLRTLPNGVGPGSFTPPVRDYSSR